MMCNSTRQWHGNVLSELGYFLGQMAHCQKITPRRQKDCICNCFLKQYTKEAHQLAILYSYVLPPVRYSDCPEVTKEGHLFLWQLAGDFS